MHHETALLATIAVGLALTFIFGFVAARLRHPPLVGYLVASIAFGSAVLFGVSFALGAAHATPPRPERVG